MKTHINTATNTARATPSTNQVVPKTPKYPNQSTQKIQLDQSNIKFGKKKTKSTPNKGGFIYPPGIICNSCCPTPTAIRK
jgi:hypothetical protein